MDNFDLIVLGSGPAGQRAAIQGAKSGKKVAVIERREVVGGACINTGTIPSKTIREAVLHLSGYLYQNVYGINYRVKEKITMADLAFRVQHVIKTEIDVTQAQLSRNNIELLTGTACFVDPQYHRGRKLPRPAGVQSRDHHHRHRHQAGGLDQGSDQRPQHHQQRPDPADAGNSQDLIVVGGGVIGVEYTCMFATLGVRVILIEKRPRLLEFADAEMVEALSYHLRDHRVTMRLNEEVASVEEKPRRPGSRQSAKQEEDLGRRAALRGRPAGQRG